MIRSPSNERTQKKISSEHDRNPEDQPEEDIAQVAVSVAFSMRANLKRPQNSLKSQRTSYIHKASVGTAAKRQTRGENSTENEFEITG